MQAKRAKRDAELEQMIASLASYICATGRPRAVLEEAVQGLAEEVGRTNRIARVCVLAASMRHATSEFAERDHRRPATVAAVVA